MPRLLVGELRAIEGVWKNYREYSNVARGEVYCATVYRMVY